MSCRAARLKGRGKPGKVGGRRTGATVAAVANQTHLAAPSGAALPGEVRAIVHAPPGPSNTSTFTGPVRLQDYAAVWFVTLLSS